VHSNPGVPARRFLWQQTRPNAAQVKACEQLWMLRKEEADLWKAPLLKLFPIYTP
jgi:hypothetical protein